MTSYWRLNDPDLIREELQRLGLWSEPPMIVRAKPSAQYEAFDHASACDGVDPPTPDCVA